MRESRSMSRRSVKTPRSPRREQRPFRHASPSTGVDYCLDLERAPYLQVRHIAAAKSRRPWDRKPSLRRHLLAPSLGPEEVRDGTDSQKPARRDNQLPTGCALQLESARPPSRTDIPSHPTFHGALAQLELPHMETSLVPKSLRSQA